MLSNFSCQIGYVAPRNCTINCINWCQSLANQTEVVLRGENLPCRIFNSLLCQSATPYCVTDPTESSIPISWLEQLIHARLQRPHSRFFLRKVDSQSTHAQCVGNDQSRKL